MPIIRAYLRASTDQQDAMRARGALDAFAKEHGVQIVSRYVENASGAKLERPALKNMLDDCNPGDIILVEQIDRLSRLEADDWRSLKYTIEDKSISVVAMDLPTSWQFLKQVEGDELQRRVLGAINSMMMDLLAAFARKDYVDRRRRQKEGIEKAKQEKRFRGRPKNLEMDRRIRTLLEKNIKWEEIQALVGCGRTTIAVAARAMKLENEQRAAQSARDKELAHA